MEFLKNFDIRSVSLWRILGIIVLGIIVLTVAISLLGFALRTATSSFFSVGYNDSSRGLYAPTAPSYEKMAVSGMEYDEVLSVRNVMPEPDYATGDAEEFEITEYSGRIRTSNLDDTCGAIEALKAPEYIIFESSNRYDHGCSYQFKVENAQVDEALSVIKGLKPETFNANTHTIKMLVDDYTSEIEILKNKLASVEETLSSAQVAYDELSKMATQVRDVESLATIIDSKVKLIERLTNERISIKERIDRINRSKAEQLDRLQYTFFSISAYEYLIIDGKQIRDSWINEMQRFVRDLNDTLQGISIGLASFMIRLLQVALYVAIAILVVKYGWRFSKRLWQGKPRREEQG